MAMLAYLTVKHSGLPMAVQHECCTEPFLLRS